MEVLSVRWRMRLLRSTRRNSNNPDDKRTATQWTRLNFIKIIHMLSRKLKRIELPSLPKFFSNENTKKRNVYSRFSGVYASRLQSSKVKENCRVARNLYNLKGLVCLYLIFEIYFRLLPFIVCKILDFIKLYNFYRKIRTSNLRLSNVII